MEKKLITFDAYSALFDIEGSIIPVVNGVLGEKLKEETTPFFRLWRIRQWDYVLLSNSLQKEHLSYDYITERALEYTCKKYKVTLSGDETARLMKGWRELNPWPEGQKVLKAVKEKGYEIAILSNGDTDMLKDLAARLDTEMDYIFSAEMAGAYKPHPNIYKLPFEKTDYPHEQVIHIAGSPFDTLGAKSAGIQCYWSNRKDDFLIDPIYAPDKEVSTLSDILELI